MIEVNLPDGNTIQVATDDPEKAAAAAASFMKQRKQAEGSKLKQIGDAILNGATIGLKDEVAGASAVVGNLVSSALGREELDVSGSFAKGREREIAPLKAIRRDNPIISTGLEILGGFGGLGAGKAITNAATTALTSGPVKSGLKAVGSGAGFGAVSGAAEAEGPVENRIAGALIGGVLGGGLAAAASIIAPTARTVKTLFKSKNPERAAKRLVLRAFERDGVPPERAASILDEWQKAGAKPEALVDLGGENVRGLARAAQATPSSAKNMALQMLSDRQETQGARLADDLASTLRLEQRGFYDVADDIMLRRSQEAGPLYDEAYKVGGLWSDKLKELSQRPSVQKAWKNAQRIAAEENVKLRPVFSTDKNGNIKEVLEIPDAQTWDYIKRGLDDVLDGFRDSTTGRLQLDTFGRAVQNTLTETRDELVRLNPKYAEALSAWGGKTSALGAMERGRQFMLRDAEITAKEIAKLSPADREFFKLGAYRQLLDMMNRVPDGGDKAAIIFKNPAKRAAIETLFEGDKDSFKFLSNLVGREQQISKSNKAVTGNSVTARLTKELEDMADDPTFLDAMISTGSVRESIIQFAQRKSREGITRAQGISAETADEIGKLLFNTDGSINKAALQSLIAEREAFAKGAGRAIAAVPTISAVSGAATGRAVAPTDGVR